tara:strand:- start:1448 stop:1849 length:402 start_codon:yes stop_codon:yes gene_type:complete
MSKFKVGDKIRRKDGATFSNGKKVVTVSGIDQGDTWLKETGSRVFISSLSSYELASDYPNPPHKHAEIIKAWADGAEVQLCSAGTWYVVPYPNWGSECGYRLAPPKPTANEVEKEAILAELAKLQKRLDSLEV